MTEIRTGMEELTVSALMQENCRSWDYDTLLELFNDRDKCLILQIPLSTRLTEDKWYWVLDNDGNFSVRSCYRKLRGERAFTYKEFWKKLWKLKLPGKVLNFLWRACRNVLPTAEALGEKHVEIDRLCSWCRVYEEDTVHTAFTCCFARELWHRVGLQSIIPTSEKGTFLQHLKRVFSSSSL